MYPNAFIAIIANEAIGRTTKMVSLKLIVIK